MSTTLKIEVSETAYDEVILEHLKECERCKTFVMHREAESVEVDNDGFTARHIILCIDCKE